MERIIIVCECGYRVKGTSEAHAQSNLEQHRKSKLHKVLMLEKNSKEEKEKENDTNIN